jgi:multicomponent Na+:H+ antiporter subunit E
MKLALVLVVVWVLLSGIFEPLVLGLGLASCLFVAWLKARADRRDGEPVAFAVRIGRLVGYLVWLSWEIVKSNIDVSRRILSPSLPVAPSVRWLPASQRSELTRVMYADSITLTPGTLSIDLTDDAVEVHALNEGSLDELERGEMDARVAALDSERTG